MNRKQYINALYRNRSNNANKQYKIVKTNDIVKEETKSMEEISKVIQTYAKVMCVLGIEITPKEIYKLHDIAYDTLNPNVVQNLCQKYMNNHL